MPYPPLDLTGQRFGRLVAVKCVGSDKYKNKLWLCKCDCGGEKITTATVLKRGTTRSCGCIASELWAVNHLSQHTTHGYSKTRLYYVWRDIINRCENKNVDEYKWYGALGVKLCDEWHDFAKFREWAMSSGYDPDAPRGKCTIDRINPYGNYEPSNCRWVSMSVQARNKRKNYNASNDVNSESGNDNA